MNTNDHPKEEDGVNFTRYTLFLVYEVSLYANVHIHSIFGDGPKSKFLLYTIIFSHYMVFGRNHSIQMSKKENLMQVKGKFALLSNTDQQDSRYQVGSLLWCRSGPSPQAFQSRVFENFIKSTLGPKIFALIPQKWFKIYLLRKMSLLQLLLCK